MVKTKEELDALKEEVESVTRKIRELTDEELAQVTGGGQGCQEFDSRDSLEGLTYNDIGNDIIINGVHFTNSGRVKCDSEGTMFYVYCGGLDIILIPM